MVVRGSGMTYSKCWGILSKVLYVTNYPSEMKIKAVSDEQKLREFVVS